MRSSSQDLSGSQDLAGLSPVIRDLQTFGPDRPSPNFSLAEAQKYCLDLASSHYENFTVASYLFPHRYRQHLANIYAYSRWADDLADESPDALSASMLLDWWEGEFNACSEARSAHPVMIALHQTLTECSLSTQPFLDLLSAFRQDQRKFQYADDMEVLDYCRRSANPVGRLVLELAHCRSDRHRLLSDSICSGLQIANFCQDIAEDASRGRIYLPISRWRKWGLCESDFSCTATNQAPHPQLKHGLAEWVHQAELLLRDGTPLVQIVPRWLARNLQMFIRGGLAITAAIAKSDYDVWREPIRVPKQQKAKILIRAFLFPRSKNFPAAAPKSFWGANSIQDTSCSKCD